MNSLNIELTNCFGIDSLIHEFNFEKGNVFSIYARNGLMKTSFAKTFQLIQKGKEEDISDAIFGDQGSAIIKIDGQNIDKKQIFVVKSYENSYESNISSLLIRGDIQNQLRDVFNVRTKLLKELEKDSGLKIKKTSLGKTVYELETTIVKDFNFNEKDILSNLAFFASYSPEIDCSRILYSVIFDDTVIKKIKDPNFQEGIRNFIKSSDEIYSSFDFLEKGNLTLPKLKDLKKALIIAMMYKLSDQLGKGYVREPHYCDVELDFTNSDYIDQNKKLDETGAKITALRRNMGNDIWSLTIMFVNDDTGKSSAKLCLFQPEIRINSENNEFTFVEYGENVDIFDLNDEEQSLALQYRNKKVYGTGLGTSISWNVDEVGRGEVYSNYFPVSEVPSMDFNLPSDSKVTKEVLSMKYMSDLVKDEKKVKCDKLLLIVEAYDKWIEDIKQRTESLDAKYQHIAEKNISGCEAASERMHEGIEILEADELSWNAFQLANRAMFMQRAHLKLQEKTADVSRYPYDEQLTDLLDRINYYNVEEILEDPYSWRPFQIAFLLLSIKSIVEDSSNDRELVDLIWFPTGGGKTEAYLGLTAFSIFYRRLAHKEDSDGTTVIMRYTLRLLAAQQFTRASTLICACEYIRVDATDQLKKESIAVRPQKGKICQVF